MHKSNSRHDFFDQDPIGRCSSLGASKLATKETPNSSAWGLVEFFRWDRNGNELKNRSCLEYVPKKYLCWFFAKGKKTKTKGSWKKKMKRSQTFVLFWISASYGFILEIFLFTYLTRIAVWSKRHRVCCRPVTLHSVGLAVGAWSFGFGCSGCNLWLRWRMRSALKPPSFLPPLWAPFFLFV